MMKLSFFVFLILSTTVNAQEPSDFGNRPAIIEDSTLGKRLRLPKLEVWHLSSPGTIDTVSPGVYRVPAKALYYELFSGHPAEILPVIDFEKQELLFTSYCVQCVTFCKDSELDYACHRNACRYSLAWFVREK
jgi:hypothetical protein